MADDIMQLTFEHRENCARQGQQVKLRPVCRDGAAEVPRVVCIETGAELHLVDTTKV